MSTAVATARRLIEAGGQLPTVSLYFDLDPARFATPEARASQATALLDQARQVPDDGALALSHTEKAQVKSDLARLAELLGSEQLPVSDARALAVFCAGAAGLLETIPLHSATPSAVHVRRGPHVEPLVTGVEAERWRLVVASTRSGSIYRGDGRQVIDVETVEDYIRGRGDRTPTTSHTGETDIDRHLRALAEAIHRDWQHSHFEVLALAGPVRPRSRLIELLHNDLVPALVDHPVTVDESSLTESTVRDAMWEVQTRAARERCEARLRELAETTRATWDLEQILESLVERRVESLLLSRDFTAAGGQCPACGRLAMEGVPACPIDGGAVQPERDLREAAVQASLAQDAEVIAFREPVDALPVTRPVAAVLRF